MKYKYRNDKHVRLNGIEPFSTKIFDHRLEGGGITLIEEIPEKKDKKDSKRVLENDKK